MHNYEVHIGHLKFSHVCLTADYKLPELPEPEGESFQKAVEVLLPYLLSHRSRLAAMCSQVLNQIRLIFVSVTATWKALQSPILISCMQAYDVFEGSEAGILHCLPAQLRRCCILGRILPILLEIAWILSRHRRLERSEGCRKGMAILEVRKSQAHQEGRRQRIPLSCKLKLTRLDMQASRILASSR